GVGRVPRVAALPLRRDRRTALPGVPVGPPPARDGAAGDPARPAAAPPRGKRTRGPGALALPARLAALPADAVVGSRQALERRSDVAPPDGAAVPLRD